MKMVVSKEQYKQVRQVEKMLGVKIALAPEEHQLRVVDCLNGQWGIYQIKHCYKSATKYFAELKLIEPATTEQEAIMKFLAIQQKKANEGKLKVVIY
ncbi:hypothetical protein [Lysinibacillus varians]|uniref:Uncharacterized protein n=1 Tax=Lysinibacillus varians TaxID=1145276 RepID=A0ABY2T8U7_9BACI|nr:hypothetical protein [Lysinibacillus varians]TKI60494.1 hypothetical protein FC752_15000 [Lysinibacillus varians]